MGRTYGKTLGAVNRDVHMETTARDNFLPTGLTKVKRLSIPVVGKGTLHSCVSLLRSTLFQRPGKGKVGMPCHPATPLWV